MSQFRRKIPKTDEEYVEAPGECPFCESTNIEGGSIDIEGDICVQPIHCMNCDGQWNDIYRLIGYERNE